jgi:hypothetical protein
MDTAANCLGYEMRATRRGLSITRYPPHLRCPKGGRIVLREDQPGNNGVNCVC